MKELVNTLDLPLLFEPDLASIHDEVFGKEFTKEDPSKILWEAGRVYIGMLCGEGKREVMEEVSDKESLGKSLKRALEKMQSMSLEPKLKKQSIESVHLVLSNG